MIIEANKYTKVSCFGWSVKPKPKQATIKKQVKRNQKSTWAKGSVLSEDIYSGDLLARMHEETDKALERDRYPGQEDFKDAKKRMGQLMLSTDFIRKVLALNKNLIYEDSKGYRGCGAFYLKQGKKKKSLNAAFRLGWMPEWTIMKTDRADLPTRDGYTPGWRGVVLQRLVQQRVLTMKQVAKHFGGYVSLGDLRGKNWSLATSQFN